MVGSRPVGPVRSCCRFARAAAVGAAVPATRGLWMLLVIASLVAAGCGSDSQPAPRRNVGSPAGVNLPHTLDQGGKPAPPRPSAVARGREGDGADERMPGAGRGARDQNGTSGRRMARRPRSAGQSAAKATTANQSEAKAKRPEKFSDWKKADFLSALADADPRLVNAVEYVGQNFSTGSNAASAAHMLVQLLTAKPDKPAESDAAKGRRQEGAERLRGRRPAAPGRRPTGQTEQVETTVAKAVVVALCKNDTPPARQAIKDLLTGKLKSSLARRAAISEVVAALVGNLNSENEKVLFVLITQPQMFSAQQSSDEAQTGDDQEQDEERLTSRLGGGRLAAGRYRGRGAGGSGAVTPDWVQGEALAAVESTASVAFRTRLGEFLNDPQVPVEIAEPLEQFLGGDNPKNLAAQILLYKNKHTTAQIRTDIEQRLTAGSVAAMAYLLDVPDQQGQRGVAGGRGPRVRRPPRASFREEDGERARFAGGRGVPGRSGLAGRLNPTGRPSLSGRPSSTGRPSLSAQAGQLEGGQAGTGAVPQPPPDPAEGHRQIAKVLWTPDLSAALEGSLASALGDDGLGSSGPLLLAGSMPTVPTRKLIHRLLTEHEDAGPQVWNAAGLLGREVCDPAILVLVKDVHHAGGKGAKRRPKRPVEPRNRGRTGGPMRAPGRGIGPDSATDQDPWTTDIMQMVIDLCARFDAAAGRSGYAAADTDRPAGLPVRLHKNANIVAEYHALWPDEATARLPGVDVAPLELHYVRIREEQRTRLLPAHYRRQVRGLIEVADGDGFWLDGFERDRDRGTERAVDIRISDIEPGARAGSSGPMTIEILTIEIPDPRPQPDTAPQPTPG